MQLKRYQIDAFAESIFKGNPAVVCPLAAWLSEEVMQNIAMEGYFKLADYKRRYRNRN